MTSRRRRLERLIQQMTDADAHNLAHSRGLAAILRWEKAHRQSDDSDPLADYRGDGSDLTGLAQLLFDARQERQACAS
jgi:hypothetical protein